MRQIRIAKANENNQAPEVDQLIVSATKKQLGASTLEAVWQKILLGDEKAIDRLVESMEIHILVVAKLYWKPTIPLEDVLHAGKKVLSNLLKAGNKADLRNRFDRFGMWWVRQEILQKINWEAENEIE